MGIPSEVADRPEVIVDGRRLIQEMKGRFRDGQKFLVRPQRGRVEHRVRQYRVRVRHSGFEPRPIRLLRMMIVFRKTVGGLFCSTFHIAHVGNVRTPKKSERLNDVGVSTQTCQLGQHWQRADDQFPGKIPKARWQATGHNLRQSQDSLSLTVAASCAIQPLALKAHEIVKPPAGAAGVFQKAQITRNAIQHSFVGLLIVQTSAQPEGSSVVVSGVAAFPPGNSVNTVLNQSRGVRHSIQMIQLRTG